MKNRERAQKFATFADRFEEARITAGKKVAQKFGRRMQKQRLGQLAGTSARRKAGVIFRVTRRGALVFLDLAPMAHPQEYGRVITPQKGSYLRVPIEPGNRGRTDDDETFVVKTRDGKLVIMRDLGNGSAEAIATLEKKIVIKRSETSRRFSTVVDSNLKNYRDELAAELVKELGK